jgi:trans-AT polyketide synthase, acyltransferase and oxidoreductase domains
MMNRTPVIPHRIIGRWTGSTPPRIGAAAIRDAVADIFHSLYLVDGNGQVAVGPGGSIAIDEDAAGGNYPGPGSYPLLACAPSLRPEALGDPEFRSDHRLRYAYVAGAMANGITSVEMVEAMGKAGMIGFFGAAGLDLDRIEAAIDRIGNRLGDRPYGFNLIHSPFDPGLQAATVDLYLQRGVRRVSASAFLDITPSLVHYRIKGIHRSREGEIVCPNHVFGKVSRQEVARKFLAPPPRKLLRQLVETGKLTPDEAAMAESVPVAGDLTAEADSGGHTDNRPAISLLPTLLALRDTLQYRFDYPRPTRIGLGGGIATPDAAAAAFAMGAAYILTGTVNQACMEAGTSEKVRQMLAEAGLAEVAMAPAADMFEMGIKVQVLKRGTMFPQRATRLYDLYRLYGSLEDLPNADRELLERDFFRCSLETAWENTRRFFETRDPAQIGRGENNPKHKMALVFRSYLGLSSNWANSGDPSRQLDYQIWCGPAIGAFNQWTAGTFLESPGNRQVVTVAKNLLFGACVATRANWLRCQGVSLPPGAGRFSPRPLETLTGEAELQSLAN